MLKMNVSLVMLHGKENYNLRTNNDEVFSMTSCIAAHNILFDSVSQISALLVPNGIIVFYFRAGSSTYLWLQ